MDMDAEAKKLAAIALRTLADQLENVVVDLHYRAHAMSEEAEEGQQGVSPV